ncbi:hypothetical protein ACIRBX_11805 [Kitasatospora sp. NPDC096147]|uniref:hypothetical protein n=1 Tax=Kitasatospora sp. NPDC096147 TaxID=3364093 RepID=UPI003824B403
MDGVEVVQTVGGWLVRLWWPGEPGGQGPQKVTIEPAADAAPRDVARGVSTTVLRRIDLAAAQVTANAGSRSEAAMPPGAELAARARQLLAEDGVSPRYLAALSAAYKLASDAGLPAPIPSLAEQIGRKPDTIRDQLKRARRDGLLTTVAGKAGGELTSKALGLLA